jgi:hypothetical protein
MREISRNKGALLNLQRGPEAETLLGLKETARTAKANAAFVLCSAINGELRKPRKQRIE